MDSPDKIIFLLGAGASVDAGGKGVVDLVFDFMNWLKLKSEPDLNVVEGIIAKLNEWISEQKIRRG